MIDLAGIAPDAIVHAIPLMLTGLAVALAFRAGVWNIGADGQFLMGATGAMAAGLVFGSAPWGIGLLVIVLAGAGAGATWALISVFLKRRFSVSEVISTIMLNFIALNCISYLVRGPLQEPTHIYPQTSALPTAFQMPVIWPQTRVHLGLFIAIATALAVWWIMRFTVAGFQLRATGASPSATSSAACVNPGRVAAVAMLCSGAMAGIAGAVEVSGVTLSLYENISPGYGYTAIAVALLGRLHPIGVVLTAVFFGALETLGSALQRDYGVPASTVLLIEAILVLGALAVDGLRASGAFRYRRYAASDTP